MLFKDTAEVSLIMISAYFTDLTDGQRIKSFDCKLRCFMLRYASYYEYIIESIEYQKHCAKIITRMSKNYK